jgi:hypothetical protein
MVNGLAVNTATMANQMKPELLKCCWWDFLHAIYNSDTSKAMFSWY